MRALADGLGGLDALPVARLRALTVDAERYRPADIVKMSEALRIATLTAFAITAAERGQDGVATAAARSATLNIGRG